MVLAITAQTRRLFRAALAAALLVTTTPCPAQAPKAVQRWQVDWGEQRCTLLRRSDSDPAITMALRIIPGALRPELSLINPEWKSNPLGITEDLEVVLLPTDLRVKATGVSVKLGDGVGRAVMMDGLGEDFLDRFAEASQFRVDRRGKPLAAFAFTGAGKAIEALRRCNDGLLEAWGMDPKQHEKLRSMPQGTVAGLFHGNDYPESSIRAGNSGMVVVLFTVGVDGRVSDCKPVGPSGDKALDHKTCSILMERARFTPAVGLDGSPTPAKQVQTIIWIVQ